VIGVADSVHATGLARLFEPFCPPSCSCLGPSRVGYKVSGTSASILVNADPTMSIPKYILPPPVYLPSSGGHTSSRLVSEVSLSTTFASPIETTHLFGMQPFHRRVFAFRRYSVDEDGRLVARTRNGGRDLYVFLIPCCARSLVDNLGISRHNPYGYPSRPSILQPNQPNHQGVPPTPQNAPPRTQMDVAILGQLFQQLTPLMKDPLSFESNAATICASFDIDPATSAEIVSSFKHQLSADRTQGSTCV